MIKKYKFNKNPVEIILGFQSRLELKDKLKSKKYKILSSKRGKKVIIEDRILGEFIDGENIFDSINNYPDITLIEKIYNSLVYEDIEVIVGFGGGSVIDVSKIVSLCLSLKENNYPIKKLLLEKTNFDINTPIENICLPTTFGTGSEVTPFATFWDFKVKKKYSFNSFELFPSTSILDHELAIGMPKTIIISTGLDAINQSVESLWNKNANKITTELSINAFVKGISALYSLNVDQQDLNSWEKMSECSLFAGLAISETKTALCHSISYPLTTHFRVPHGIACAFSMPSVLEFCLDYDDGRLKKLANRLEIYKDYKTNLKDLFERINENFGIKKIIKKYINNEKNLLELVGEMYDPARAKNLMRKVSYSDIENILKKSYI